MQSSVALTRYLQRHIEPELPSAPAPSRPPWQQVLVVPCYDEPAATVGAFGHLAGDGRILVILVLNRPEWDADGGVNDALREALGALHPVHTALPHGYRLAQAGPGLDFLTCDLDRLLGPLPKAKGVGLARKFGCDLALAWMAAGAISGEWICCSDADARLPTDYFARLPGGDSPAPACLFPFLHQAGNDPACNRATALYEARLHHYVLGLQHARSPYAYHSLGSCLAVRAGAYAAVRGFPRRSGAEDFYLLGKLAKLGPLAQPGGECIRLQARYSRRVPFGTGPAVADIAAASEPEALPLFYHPRSFEALRVLLAQLPRLREPAAPALTEALVEGGLDPALADQCNSVLQELGIDKALAHCCRQGRDGASFSRHFHQWFDAFRTLKFVHALRDRSLPNIGLHELTRVSPTLWPVPEDQAASCEQLLAAVRARWGWYETDH